MPKSRFSDSPSQDASSGKELNPGHEYTALIDCATVANDPQAPRKEACCSPALPPTLMRTGFQFTSGVHLCPDTKFPPPLVKPCPSNPNLIWKQARFLGCTRQFPPRLGRVDARFDPRASPHKCHLGPSPPEPQFAQVQDTEPEDVLRNQLYPSTFPVALPPAIPGSMLSLSGAPSKHPAALPGA